MTKLLLCPFCNGLPKMYDQDSFTNKRKEYSIQCTVCLVLFPYIKGKNKIIKLWNSRMVCPE